MTKKIVSVLSCLSILFVAVGTSDAGTKWQTSLVPESAVDPTIIEKSKVSFKDSGLAKISVQGLTDATGTLVTTDTSWTKNKVLNGDEYMVIVTGNFPFLGVGFQFNIPFEAKGGKGKGKFLSSSLFNLIPAGNHRAMEMLSSKVVGPLGAANFLDCCANVTCSKASFGGGFVVDLGAGFSNPCDQGDLIGVGGVLIPE